jgi:hypothetical protein
MRRRWRRRNSARASKSARAAFAARAEVLRKLSDLLPDVVRLETRYDRDVSEAQSRAERAYRECFDAEVAATLEDPAFDRAAAERIARCELRSFRQDVERELEDLVAQHRRRLHAVVGRLLADQGDG